MSPDSLIKTWGLKLLEGRDFYPSETVEVENSIANAGFQVAIITLPLAKKMWPHSTSALGKEMYLDLDYGAKPVRIVGVVERLQTAEALTGQQGEYSTIFPARIAHQETFAIRTAPRQLDRAIKDAEATLMKLYSNEVIVKSASHSELRHRRYRNDIALAWLLGGVSLLLLLVTACGIMGIASF